MTESGEEKKAVSPVNGQPVPKGKPFTTGDKRASEAGKRSAEARAARKTLREEMLELLTVQIPDSSTGETIDTQIALSKALIRQALKGNVRAYETIRDTIGEKPLERVEVTAPDMSALDDAFRGANAE